jgi:hypothetical protein
MGKCYELLRLFELVYIQAQLELGFEASAIAASKWEPSTIRGELRRNEWKRPARSPANLQQPAALSRVPRRDLLVSDHVEKPSAN